MEKSGRKNGTNICRVPLISHQADQSEVIPSNSSPTAVPVVIPVLIVLLCVIAAIVIFFVYRRKRRKRRNNSSQDNKPCTIDSAAQNPICQRQIKRNSLSLSRINVNVKEVRGSSVSQSENDRTASVKLLASNVTTRGRGQRLAGTEV